MTELTTWDGRNVQIPNADVYILPIINFSRSRERRVTLIIPILQGADLELASRSAAHAAKMLPGVLPDREPVTIFPVSGQRSCSLNCIYGLILLKSAF